MVAIDGIKIADMGFYMNLDYRTDRNEKILENLQEYNITGVERQSADRSTYTPQLNLIKTTFEIYKKFLASDAETLLILEDDCKFLPTIQDNTEQIFKDIHSTDWDLFWLGGVNRKPPVYYKNNCYRVSSTSYAQSYIIKRKMAQDVLNAFEQHWYNLGIDEMLCLFTYGFEVATDPFGLDFYKADQPLDHFTPLYTVLCYETAFTTQYNSYSDNWNVLTNLEEWLPRHNPTKYFHKVTQDEKSIKVLAITWNNEDTFDLESTYLYQSFIKHNNPEDIINIHFNRNQYADLEKDFESKYGYQYEFLLYRLYLVLDKIRDMPYTHFIVSDTTDVVCLGDIKTIKAGKGILFSSEANRYPWSMGDWGVPEYSEQEQAEKTYINGGLFLADKGGYIDLLNAIRQHIFPKNLKSLGGDQGVFAYHYLSKLNPQITLDKENKLFLCTYDRNAADFVDYEFPMFVHDNGWNWGSPKFIHKFNLI